MKTLDKSLDSLDSLDTLALSLSSGHPKSKNTYGSAPGLVDFLSVRIWSLLEGSCHAQSIPCGVPS